MEVAEVPKDIAQKVYIGLDEQHNTNWIQKGWSEQISPDFPENLRALDVDERISFQINECLARNEHDITVIDIGSGSEGYFIKSFLDASQFPKLHRVMSENSGLNLRVIGATGAKSGDEQGSMVSHDEVSIGSDETNQSKIAVDNYKYTITKAHTLNNLLDNKNIKNINLAFSTFGIGYFTPNNFEQCLTDIADRLAAKGEFYGITWDAVPAGARRGLIGLFHIFNSRVTKEHPLKAVAGGMTSAEFKQFYEQSPQEQINAYITAIDFGVSRGFITEEQAKHLIMDRDLLPIPAFVRRFYAYTDLNEQLDIIKHLNAYAKKYPWVNEIQWTNGEDLIEKISRTYTTYVVENKPKDKALPMFLGFMKRNRNIWHNEGDEVRDATWKYIEEKYANTIRRKLVKEKETLNTKSGSLDWKGLKDEISKSNPLLVADFWDWDGIARKYEELFVEKQASYTTNSKQKTIDSLSQRGDLNVYSSKVPDSHGLNIYIGKK